MDSSVASIRYPEAVEEALCFGWIDSRPNVRDGESYYLLFTQRSPKSKWSALNKRRVAALTRAGLMTSAGKAMITLAKRTGTWTALNASDKMIIPRDLAAAFKKNGAAKKNFDAFPPSAKKAILEWINSAKQPETRKRRVTETASLAAKNIRANQWTKRPSAE
jgi:uncharacterized protein YdeI (YjbR/CyaY-like superfamily)